jgi:hypothetical protein
MKGGISWKRGKVGREENLKESFDSSCTPRWQQAATGNSQQGLSVAGLGNCGILNLMRRPSLYEALADRPADRPADQLY